MTTAVDCGAERLRDIRGECCDLCGDVCHPEAEILVAISCGRCDSLIYHQGCVEKFLKKHGFESNRKTGFPCPRGRGKATRFSDECKGRVDKSHPIIPRNEDKKKKSLAPPISEVLAKQVKAKPDPKAKQQQQAKPPAVPRKAPQPSAQQATTTVLRSNAPVRSPLAPAANVWHNAGASSAVREAPAPADTSATAAAAAAAAELEKPKGPHVPVGLVLEEALTKAQKKNLQRRKKKQDTAGDEGHSEAGAAATDASSMNGWDRGAGSSNGGTSSSSGTTAGAAALLSSNTFVTDIKRYQQLLGLYVGDDDDSDVDDADVPYAADDSDSDMGSIAASAALTSPGSSSSISHSTASTPSVAAAAFGGSNSMVASDADDAAIAAIMEQSRREYELQQEMQRQRDMLGGYCAGPVAGQRTDEPLVRAASPPVVLPAFTVPVAQPVIVPTSAPVVVPAAAPVAAPVPVPVVVPVAAPEPAPAHAGFAGLGYHQQPALPLWQQQMSFKSTAVATAGSYGVQQATAYGVVPMAAGHGVIAAAGGDDDDELDSLLALCGVAG